MLKTQELHRIVSPSDFHALPDPNPLPSTFPHCQSIIYVYMLHCCLRKQSYAALQHIIFLYHVISFA